MRQIVLTELIIENFKSFRAQTIIFSTDAGLKFIGGRNEVEPRLGANGVGKSSLWDAWCFCWYGVSVKGNRASDLTMWGAKQPYVRTEFFINKEPIRIERWGNPNKLLINEVPSEQIDVDRLVGLTRARFCQAVLFGQAVPLFLDLSIPQRGELLDDVLSLGHWLQLAEHAGRKHAELTKQINKVDTDIAHAQGVLSAIGDLSALERLNTTWERTHGEELDKLIDEVEAAEQATVQAEETLATARARLAELPNLASIRQRISESDRLIATYDAEYKVTFTLHKEALDNVEYYQHTKTCNVCKQVINAVFAKNQLVRHNIQVDELAKRMSANGVACNRARAVLEQDYNELSTASTKREHWLKQITLNEAELAQQQRAVDVITKAVEAKAAETNPHAEQLELQKHKKVQTEATLAQLFNDRRKLAGQALRVEFWKQGFRRLRLFLINRILKQMEVETENAASALGLPGWQIQFTTETETKGGTSKAGVQIQVISPAAQGPWEVWSGGETQRIRLAVSLGIAAMVQRMAGVQFKLEVFDEPSAFLSTEGIEDLLECLKYRASTLARSVWVSDHQALTYSGFDEVWEITKDADGSHLRCLGRDIPTVPPPPKRDPRIAELRTRG